MIANGLYITPDRIYYRVVGTVFDKDTNQAKVLYTNKYGEYLSMTLDNWLEADEDIYGNVVQKFRRISD